LKTVSGRPARHPAPAVIMIAGMGDHDPPDPAITIKWNA
jgi:hypothetical protein